MAAGNANGDLPMLRFAGSGLRLVVRHDDPRREFDHIAGAEAVLGDGNTEVSIRVDWSRVFS